jgi:hypothetical protein
MGDQLAFFSLPCATVRLIDVPRDRRMSPRMAIIHSGTLRAKQRSVLTEQMFWEMDMSEGGRDGKITDGEIDRC